MLLIPRCTGTSAANRVYRHAETAKRNEAAVAADPAAVAAVAGQLRTEMDSWDRTRSRWDGVCGDGGKKRLGGETEMERGTEKRCVCSDRRNGRGGGENK